MRIPRNGGSTFAERPELEAPDARIIWHADLDPGTLDVVAVPTDRNDPDGMHPAMLAPWLTLVADVRGIEHAVLSDGWHHIRLDIDDGTLRGETAVVLHYRMHGRVSAERRLLPLRQFLHLCRRRQFARSLFPHDPHINRLVDMLRVHDALEQGASQREIGAVLFGAERMANDWIGASDSLRSRVRRLVREAGIMARGGYRTLLKGLK